MIIIHGRNVNYAYTEALWKMKALGVQVSTRNGKAMRILGPVATIYDHPTERMLRDVKRDANPFFHIFEAIWMLAGRNDVQWLERFNSNIGRYSDDGKTLAGAYGFRWREHFAGDQLWWLIHHLQHDPSSRRAVLQMFDPKVDQPMTTDPQSKDIPCNTGIYFEIVEGVLNMTVTNRSNDMIWGCYGANVVHMSMLMEFVANALGVSVGKYIQISNNFHIYEIHFPLLDCPTEPRGYTTKEYASHVSLASPERWKQDLNEFEEWCENPNDSFHKNKFITDVLNPMITAWRYYKRKEKDASLLACDTIRDLEIRFACEEWLHRRNWEKETT